MAEAVTRIFVVFLELLTVVTIHELGHWIVAAVLRAPVSSVNVGSGPLVRERLFGGVWFRLRLIPFSGSVVLCWRSRRRWHNVAVYAAGPLANLLLAGALFWTEIGILSAIMAVINLIPKKRGEVESDGLKILREMRR